MVTIKEGQLSNQTYKGSMVESENVTLVGTEMVIENKKVIKFNGVIQNLSKEQIGTFEYQNNATPNAMSPYMGYKCNVQVNKESDAKLQIEATTALLLGIGEFEKI